ncbi:MAG: DNA mismatch repair endonuclease MutL [Lachnospiraceae bacterium]
MSIAVLDESTINKIAAGEVIERPASIVKELLENAIDASASAITVEIRDGGTSLIRITDNGCGISKEEVPLAFLRHATSKIKRAEDLSSVLSLGFRGEALASIAAVSRVELITKTGDSLTGSRYRIEGSAEVGMEEVGVPDGTTFLVRDLFYNTPARKKFLKQPATEGGYVQDFVEKIALSRPDISIRYLKGGTSVLHTSGNHNLKDIIYQIYGRELTANLLSIETAVGPVQISGYICKPIVARSNRSCETYFINGRYVKNPLISRAIEEAYQPFLMKHKFPFTVLHLTIDTQTLDVNVHPAKMEVRFQNGDIIYQAVYHAVSEALHEKELIPEISLEKEEKSVSQSKPSVREVPRMPEPFETKRLAQMVKEPEPVYGARTASQILEKPEPLEPQPPVKEPEFLKQSELPKQPAASRQPDSFKQPESVKKTDIVKQPEPPKQMELFDGKLLDSKARFRHKLIGQLFDTYWMVEYNDQLFIIDQHAAHEKVLYERTMKALKERVYDTQMLSPPIILTLSIQEKMALQIHMDYFSGMGFEIEPFGGKEYAVRGVPSNLLSIAKKELLLEMLGSLTEEKFSENAASPEMIYERVASMSCKAAVKGGHTLTFREADELIDQLLELENPYACPHGRPTIISMSKYELEKKFKRIV